MTHTIRPLARHDLLNVALLVADAFTRPDGALPERYEPTVIIPRLAHALAHADDPWAPRYLVADIGGAAVAIGGYARSRSAADTWELMLAATRPDMQHRGIGHALMLARWEAIRAEAHGGGLVQVSTRNTARFARYGFQQGPRNPSTGACVMWAMVPASGRAAA